MKTTNQLSEDYWQAISTDGIVIQIQHYRATAELLSPTEAQRMADGFQELHRRLFEPNVSRIKRRFYLHPEDIEDMVQTIIGKFTTEIIQDFKIQTENSTERYISRAVKNSAINLCRRQPSLPFPATEAEDGAEALEWLFAHDESAEANELKNERLERRHQMMANAGLTEREKRILHYLLEGERTRDEVLALENMSIGRWYKVCADLKRKLNPNRGAST